MSFRECCVQGCLVNDAKGNRKPLYKFPEDKVLTVLTETFNHRKYIMIELNKNKLIQ